MYNIFLTSRSLYIAQWLNIQECKRSSVNTQFWRGNSLHYVNRQLALTGGHYKLRRCLIHDSQDLASASSEINKGKPPFYKYE